MLPRYMYVQHARTRVHVAVMYLLPVGCMCTLHSTYSTEAHINTIQYTCTYPEQVL